MRGAGEKYGVDKNILGRIINNNQPLKTLKENRKIGNTSTPELVKDCLEYINGYKRILGNPKL